MNICFLLYFFFFKGLNVWQILDLSVFIFLFILTKWYKNVISGHLSVFARIPVHPYYQSKTFNLI